MTGSKTENVNDIRGWRNSLYTNIHNHRFILQTLKSHIFFKHKSVHTQHKIKATPPTTTTRHYSTELNWAIKCQGDKGSYKPDCLLALSSFQNLHCLEPIDVPLHAQEQLIVLDEMRFGTQQSHLQMPQRA